MKTIEIHEDKKSSTFDFSVGNISFTIEELLFYNKNSKAMLLCMLSVDEKHPSEIWFYDAGTIRSINGRLQTNRKS